MPDHTEDIDEVARIKCDLQFGAANICVDETLAISTLGGGCGDFDRPRHRIAFAGVDGDSDDIVVVACEVAGSSDCVHQPIAPYVDASIELAGNDLSVVRECA